MITAIIIDDEAKGRITLEKMIEDYCTNIKIVATAEDVLSGVKVIHAHQPDLVFLDIEMPNYSGFKLIEYFDKVDFEVIFTTAYSQHAIQAFKVSAIAYLLKPIDIQELQEAIAKVEKLRQSRQDDYRIQYLQESLSNDKLERIVLPAQNSWIYLNLDEINYLESEGRNTIVHLADSTKQHSTQSLKECQQALENTTFIRIHRSFIVNLRHIKHYSKGRDSYVQMDNDVRIDVGKNYKDELNEVVSYFVK